MPFHRKVEALALDDIGGQSFADKADIIEESDGQPSEVVLNKENRRQDKLKGSYRRIRRETEVGVPTRREMTDALAAIVEPPTANSKVVTLEANMSRGQFEVCRG